MKLFNKLTCRSSANAPIQSNQPSTYSIIIGLDHFKALLYSGYFRTNYNSAIPSEIINLCTSFSDYLCYHWIMQQPQFTKQPRYYATEVRSPNISINVINFQILIECLTDNFFEITPQITVLNDGITSTTLRFGYYLIVNGSLACRNKRKSDWFTWDNSKSSSRSVEFQRKTHIDNIHLIKLEVYPEIFDIRYKDKSKRFDKQAKLCRKVTYKWNIDDEKLKLFKTTYSTFNSPCFGNWELFFTPYGSNGHCSLGLRLDSLPSALGYFMAKVTFTYKTEGKTSKKCTLEERLFGFHSSYNKFKMKAYWKKNTLLSSEFFEMKSLYFIVDIEIIKVYRWSKNRSLPIYQWESYNIMNRTYTNIDQKNLIELQKDTTSQDVLQLILKKLDVLEKRMTKLEEKYP